MKKTLFMLIALIAAFSLMIVGCGSQEPQETAAPETAAPVVDVPLGLQSWDMSTSTWSSPNGATVHLTAVPNAYEEGQTAAFIVRLEGDEVDRTECTWDNGGFYTASSDLNAEDGYCYYVLLTSPDGEQLEVAVNTPAEPTDEAIVNLSTSLNSYCHLLVTASDADGKKLTITGGTAQIQPPQISDDGQSITCAEAVLVLSHNGTEVDRKTLKLPEPGAGGLYELSIADNRFDIPAMEDDQQLTLRLDVTLSNGQLLTDTNGTWSYIGGELISAVG